jgi:hypothetical protein
MSKGGDFMISIDITDSQIKLIEAKLVANKVSVKKAAKRDLVPGHRKRQHS